MDHFNINITSIIEFKKKNSRGVDLANKLVNLSGLVTSVFFHINFESFHQQLLVQRVFKNFKESLFFCMRSEPESALSMARIAAEGSRNLLRMLDDPTLIDLYSLPPSSKAQKENQKRWRKEFRFNDNEAELLNLYNIGSEFGIHATHLMHDKLSSIKNIMGKNVRSINQKNHSKKVFIIIMLTMHLAMSRFMTSASKEVKKDKKAMALSRQFIEEWNKLLPDLSEQNNLLSKIVDD